MMNSSNTFGHVAAALAAAQGELKNPVKGKTARIDSAKGRFTYTYADFAAALEMIRPILSKNKLALVQTPFIVDGNYVMLDTRVIHETGEWLGNVYPVGLVADHRTLGSSLSYARRYSAFPLLAIQGEEEDDDAEQTATTAKAEAPTLAETGAVESVGDTYVRKFNEAQTAAAFEEEVGKARAAWSRMNAADKTKVSNSIEARRAHWESRALEGPEQ